ncbi:hypothetical protein [Rugamonas aquatica]|uniref:Uncharacterized protein n=1 Tax=Rugamonas aquatica TaxID=2743357 RepID=A0A6A7N2P5_9BURK|nr:hypothetical protein [Rugamonas aquatica]MQA39276.1 hypothetical protein [Rugamonas aquatica]
MSITNYEGLRVVLRPGPLPNTYEFVVENNGDLLLWDVQLDVYPLQGPGAFGLDDTHMHAVPEHQRTATIDSLAPGASVCIAQETWINRASFKVTAKRKLLSGTFSTSQGGAPRWGLRADFVIAPPILRDR